MRTPHRRKRGGYVRKTGVQVSSDLRQTLETSLAAADPNRPIYRKPPTGERIVYTTKIGKDGKFIRAE